MSATPAAQADLFSFIQPLPADAQPALAEVSSPVSSPTPPAAAAQPLTHGMPPSPADLAEAEREVSWLRSKGASEDEIYRMRARLLSPEAASRLSELDRAERAWQQRISAYLSERASLAAAQGLPENALPPALLQPLRDRHFSAAEQARLAGHEAPLAPQLTPF